MAVSREDAVRYITQQFSSGYTTLFSKFDKHHYGLQELKDLLDFIYGEVPTRKEEGLYISSYGMDEKEADEKRRAYQREREEACRKYSLIKKEEAL